jgi:hypothetical protein
MYATVNCFIPFVTDKPLTTRTYWLQAGWTNFSFRYYNQIRLWTPFPYTVGLWSTLPVVWCSHWPQYSVLRLRIREASPPLSPYEFTVWCKGKCNITILVIVIIIIINLSSLKLSGQLRSYASFCRMSSQIFIHLAGNRLFWVGHLKIIVSPVSSADAYQCSDWLCI